MTFPSRLEMCHCSHHKATHHEQGDCLGMHCECKGYQDSEKPYKPRVEIKIAKPEPDPDYYYGGWAGWRPKP